jgi:hypothetical protein
MAPARAPSACMGNSQRIVSEPPGGQTQNLRVRRSRDRTSTGFALKNVRETHRRKINSSPGPCWGTDSSKLHHGFEEFHEAT